MKPGSSTSPVAARRERLRSLMEERRLPLAVVTNLTTICYLTGFHGSAGIALIDPEEATLLVDPRYTLQARDQEGCFFGVNQCNPGTPVEPRQIRDVRKVRDHGKREPPFFHQRTEPLSPGCDRACRGTWLHPRKQKRGDLCLL